MDDLDSDPESVDSGVEHQKSYLRAICRHLVVVPELSEQEKAMVFQSCSMFFFLLFFFFSFYDV